MGATQSLRDRISSRSSEMSRTAAPSALASRSLARTNAVASTSRPWGGGGAVWSLHVVSGQDAPGELVQARVVEQAAWGERGVKVIVQRGVLHQGEGGDGGDLDAFCRDVADPHPPSCHGRQVGHVAASEADLP